MQHASSHSSKYTSNQLRTIEFPQVDTGTARTALTVAVAIAIFICDLFTELGIAIGVTYILVVWMADTTERPRVVWLIAILCSVLTVAGFAKSPDGGEWFKVTANRGLSLLAIWLTTYFVLQRRRVSLELAESNRQLKKSNHALEQSNTDLQQFAFVASHDLQTPLRHISSFVQLLQSECKDRLSDEENEWIGFAVNGVDKMKALINALLMLSRIEFTTASFEPVDLNNVFDYAYDMFNDEGAIVTRDTLPTVAGDDAQLSQLFQNLISNAIKYRGELAPRLHVSAEARGDEWLISVRDNGIGINPKHHERIFDVFRRLHTEEEYPGAGIGLATCQRVVRRHGGRIWVESEPGAGSTFCFTIPGQGK